MTTENKNLLLKEICARFPYGVLLVCEGRDGYLKPIKINKRTITEGYILCADGGFGLVPVNIENVKLVLYPKYYNAFVQKKLSVVITTSECGEFLDTSNENYVDYRGLIEKGLAIDVTTLKDDPYKDNETR